MSITHTEIKIGGHCAQHFTLTNCQGMTVELTNWGATLLDIQTADRDGRLQSVTLAHADVNTYAENAPYFGCIIGRVAGRIAHGQFHLDGQHYRLKKNQGEHHLHGGMSAMSHQLWRVEAENESNEGVSIVFGYDSVAGENDYPGILSITVRYRLDHENSLHIDYEANTDVPTLCNLTNHAYFNLSGNTQRTMYEQTLQVNASSVYEMDENLLVTGGEWAVAGCDFDFRKPRELKEALCSEDPRLTMAQGIDHYFKLDSRLDDSLKNEPQIILFDRLSGRRLQVFTDQPCVVLYAHNYANAEALRYGVIGQPHDALCIETQGLPSQLYANGDHAAALYPQQTYHQHTRFCFDVI